MGRKKNVEPGAQDQTPATPQAAGTPAGSEAPKETPKNAVTVHKGGGAVANTGGRKLAGRGFENLEQSDLLLPRIKLLQPLSPEIKDLDQKPGTIFLGLSNKSFGNKIVITPVLHFRSRIKWIPEDDGGGIDCSSPDGRVPREKKYAQDCASCTHHLWNETATKKKDKQPKCTLYDNFLVLIEGSNEPVIIPMERSKQRVAKKFYSLGVLKGGDMWDHQYELSVVDEENEDGKQFYNYSVRDISKQSPDDRKKAALTLWESLVGKTISEVNQESEGAPAGAPVGNAY